MIYSELAQLIRVLSFFAHLFAVFTEQQHEIHKCCVYWKDENHDGEVVLCFLLEFRLSFHSKLEDSCGNDRHAK